MARVVTLLPCLQELLSLSSGQGTPLSSLSLSSQTPKQASTVFCVVTPCNSKTSRCVGGAYCLHLQGRKLSEARNQQKWSAFERVGESLKLGHDTWLSLIVAIILSCSYCLPVTHIPAELAWSQSYCAYTRGKRKKRKMLAEIKAQLLNFALQMESSALLSQYSDGL
jgi:hypothetical protein